MIYSSSAILPRVLYIEMILHQKNHVHLCLFYLPLSLMMLSTANKYPLFTFTYLRKAPVNLSNGRFS